MAGLQGWQLVIIILLAILLFAAPKLPAMRQPCCCSKPA